MHVGRSIGGLSDVEIQDMFDDSNTEDVEELTGWKNEYREVGDVIDHNEFDQDQDDKDICELSFCPLTKKAQTS